MTIGGAFRRLTRTLRRIERAGWTIENVEPADGNGFRRGDEVSVTVHCHPTEDSSTTPTELSCLSAGDISGTVEAVIHGVEEAANSRVLIEVPLHKAQHSESIEVTDDLPLHLDVARLEKLYAEHATFESMADAVNENVSDETIRRYTIEHNIHRPNEPRERSKQRASSVSTDRQSVPEPVDTDQVIEAVSRSRSLYEVQQRLGLERDTTVATLRRLDLLDLAVTQGTDPIDGEVRRETITRRVDRVGHDGTRVTASGRNG